jgi:hypothetical protein
MVTIQNMKSITIEGGQSVFCGYDYIKDIIDIELSDEQVGMFLNCCSIFNGLADLINNKLDESYSENGVDYLVSIIPLVSFREYLAFPAAYELVLSKEEIAFFQFLFDETKSWKSKGCDLICISGAKIAEEGM